MISLSTKNTSILTLREILSPFHLIEETLPIYFARSLDDYRIFDGRFVNYEIRVCFLAARILCSEALLHPWARCVVQFCGFLHASSSSFFFFPSWFSSGLDRVRGQISAVAGPQPVRWLAIITT